MQLLFDLVQQVERVLTVAVHLIDKHDHGSLTHTADFHQLTGLGFHTFCGIDHDNNAIHSRQRTKRIFSEILVAGRIEDIDFMAGIIESITEVATEIPRCFSISIQSEVAVFLILLDFTAPAT